jgi:HK97 family phage major capsid protein
MKKNPNDLRVKAEAKKKEADDMQARIDGEDRDWTVEEDAQFKALAQEATDLYAEAAAIEKRDNERAAASAGLGRITDAGGRKTTPEGPTKERAVADVGIPNILEDGMWGFKSFDHFMAGVVKSGRLPRTGGLFRDEHFSRVDDAFRSVKGAAGAATFSDEEGGFLVPKDTSDGIYSRAKNVLPIIGMCDQRTVVGNSYEMKAIKDNDASSVTLRYGGVIPYNVDEGGEITSSKLNFRLVTFRLHKKGLLYYVTSEELDDTVNFGAIIQGKMMDALVGETIEDILNGAGVNTALGMLHANNGARVSVAIESGQVRATTPIQGENLLWMNAQRAMTGKPYVWLVNQEIGPWLDMATLPGGVNRYPMLMATAGGLQDANMIGRIKGHLVYETDHCAAPATVGDIALVDPSQYVLVTKGSKVPQMEMSIHVRFIYDELGFRMTYRQDGRPIWETYYTPRKGSRTQSPFVCLAAS